MILPFFLFTYHDLTYENQDGHEEQDKLLNSPEVSIFHVITEIPLKISLRAVVFGRTRGTRKDRQFFHCRLLY